MVAFATLRLGKDSVSDIQTIDAHHTAPPEPLPLQVTCKQVPQNLSVGDYVFLVLGSDTNKGQATDWSRGVRAIATVENRQGQSWKDDTTIQLSVGVIFESSIDKKELLRSAPSAYYWFSEIPILGIDEYANQTVQMIRTEQQFQDVAALLFAITRIHPQTKTDIANIYPDLAVRLNYTPPPAISGPPDPQEKEEQLGEDEKRALSTVRDLINEGKKLFLFTGPPGTGKTRHARKVVETLTSGDPDRSVFVQFHPSYSYDDFVEGFVPTGRLDGNGNAALFTLREKVFLKLCEDARNTPEHEFFLVIDELSRGDASRIFGELLTYLEPDYRNTTFTLAYSARQSFSIPENITVIATMNPFDRSVAEIDSALDRRFTKLRFGPDPEALRQILLDKGAQSDFVDEVISLFTELQDQLPVGGIGHAYFKDVIDRESLRRTWEHELVFFFENAFRFESEALTDVKQRFEEVMAPTLG